jgi:DNA-directed RNA polymerase specialized sigma24 family protein
MAYGTKTFFVDQTGHPFSDRLQEVLRVLKPRLRRQFPSLRDDVVITEILEEAGRRIVEHERHVGAIEKLRGYAWVAVRHVATSRLRRASMRLQQQTLDSADSLSALADLPAERTSPAAIERDLLLAQVLNLVSAEERKVCIWKKCGFSSRQIAWYRGHSTEAVDTMFFRAKQKVRKALGLGAGQDARPARTEPVE